VTRFSFPGPSRRSLASLLPLWSLLAACDAGGGNPRTSRTAPASVASTLSGQELAARYCQGCHLLPEPAMLNKQTWRNWVLPAMGHRLGIYDRPGVREDSLLAGPGGDLVRQAGIFPEQPALPHAEWDRIVDYYLSLAPTELPQPPERPLRMGLSRFRVRIPAFRARPPLTTLVRIDSASGRLFIGDTKQDFSTLEILDRRFQPVQSLGLESAPADVRVAGDSLDVLLMGRLLPSDAPSGLLRKLLRRPGETQYGAAMRLVDGLFRPVHASYADLDGDAREDVVVSEFGNLIGRLAWYGRSATGDYVRHVLRPVSGAIATEVRDVDGDGRPDILALVAQGDEGVLLYHNEGEGRFREERLLRLPASYGTISFQTADFNGDGHWDILHSAGDNGDYPAVGKPYHGVRIFLNDGKNRFRDAYFFPLHGAFKAVARDFDQDGDLDIAAIAFYPEYRHGRPEGFVYLESRGGLKFDASTFPEADQGRWITFDAGDVDGDGDLDLVLGSFVAFDPTGDTTGLHQRWLRGGPSIIVLENTTR